MELGIYTFGELTDPSISPQERMRDLLEEVSLADEVGLDVYAVGEHHRDDYLVSSPGIVLAAAAARTERIRLSSAVNVLSSDDPVRVFEQFALLDLISGGRAEIMAGRGSFVESFPLFGYDLRDYESLFTEKLELLLALRASERVTWSGRHRAPLEDQAVHPRPLQDPLPVWLAVGANPESVIRTGTLGLPMALAIIGGMPERFVPYVELYRRSLADAGHAPQALGINLHGYVADTSQRARDEWLGPQAVTMDRIGRERGLPPATRADYEALCAPRGAFTVGSPQEVAEKILFHHELFGHDRVLIQLTVGTMPHAHVLRAIELYGTEVAPLVRSEVARRLAA